MQGELGQTNVWVFKALWLVGPRDRGRQTAAVASSEGQGKARWQCSHVKNISASVSWDRKDTPSAERDGSRQPSHPGPGLSRGASCGLKDQEPVVKSTDLKVAQSCPTLCDPHRL